LGGADGLSAEHAVQTRHGDGGQAARETPRSRRLHDDEAARLLAACDPHLRAVVEAALETGMRRGEFLSLRWSEIEGLKVDEQKVTWAPRSQIVLQAGKTKTRRERKIPISSRLRAILELRRFDPAGHPHDLEKFAFGNALGQRVLSTKRSFMTAVLKAHGEKPSYTKTMNLDPASRAILNKIDLHFHDLRREAGSRWMDAGVPIATIQRWLGHTNVSQTSTYLAGTSTTERDHMRRFEAQQADLQKFANRGGKRHPQRPRSATAAIKKPTDILSSRSHRPTLPEQGRQIGVRLFNRPDRLQPPHEVEPRLAPPLSHLPRSECHRSPDIGRFAWGFSREARGRDSDDRERDSVDGDWLADCCRGLMKPATPVVVADDCHGLHLVRGGEDPAKNGSDHEGKGRNRRRSRASAVRHESAARPSAGSPAPSCESAYGCRRGRYSGLDIRTSSHACSAARNLGTASGAASSSISGLRGSFANPR
jgi:integrase